MKKRSSKVAILALSLLLLVGMVASAMAANGTNGQAGLRQGNAAGQQKAQTTLQAVSDLTGLSIADIRSQRAEGKSLAAIAESKGVSEQAVIDKVIAERTAILDELKADKKISGEQYQACLNNMAERIKANVERTVLGPKNGNQRGQGRGHMQGFGQGQGRGAGCGQNQANCPYAAPANQ
ncbi:MAG: hypothetical protein PHP26_09005 [Syntrophomonas sp.]|jgi:predicted DNA-binding protein YlxM (UPF0122 family)|nr:MULTISPECIES: hypothetical protein [Syntrophomonas]MDD2511262.1 hypothetical protein [Syntrophomonas sp.]MDD3880112.1 hypothetical protein [Syntrophomonas sp.]MDD4627231.1 hypothetical protein [Syntrophomonas sp.]